MRGRNIRQTSVRTVQKDAPSRGGQGGSFSLFSFVMVGVVIFGFVILAPIAHRLVMQNIAVHEKQTKINQIAHEIEALTAERKRWEDPIFVQAQARERLYYVLPGETHLFVIDDRSPSDPVQQTDAPSEVAQQIEKDWKEKIFQSFMGAGLSAEAYNLITGGGIP